MLFRIVSCSYQQKKKLKVLEAKYVVNRNSPSKRNLHSRIIQRLFLLLVHKADNIEK